MKEKTFIAILSIATVVLGGLVVLAETSLLVNHGVEPDAALIDSLYSGFLDWFWNLTKKIIKK